MKILSINVSEPQKVIFNGKELITSIYKKPVSNLVHVSSQGIDGDRQADLTVHGGYDKAVYAYSHAHYKTWATEMKKEFNEYGLVGENLTIDDFNESEINIGDQFKINECILQVSQPRIPCYKIGIKMNSRDFPKMFSQSGLLGSYLRVIKDGDITAGDEIQKIHHEENSMSLKDIANLLFVDIKNIELMKKALNIDTLTEEIKEKFRGRLMKLGDFSSLYIMIKRQNLKILKNHETSISCDGDSVSGRHPKIFLTLKDGGAECYYCGKLFVTEDAHEKYLNKARKNFKKNKNV